MQTPATVYTHCDELEQLPAENRDNWLQESAVISSLLKTNASVLQVGCANASRLIDLKTRRPDVRFLGIDIEEDLLKDARRNIEKAGLQLETRLCDITADEKCAALGHFDYVLCLNNTLGYIPDESAALRNMKSLGSQVLMSVYGEKFGDDLAQQYFTTLGLKVQTIADNRFTFADFSSVKRYARADVDSWGGLITETPLGYLCILSHAS